MDENEISEEEESDQQEEEVVLDPNNPDHYFPIVERDFNKTLAAIEKIPEALQFIENFNKLFESFFFIYAKYTDLQQVSAEMKTDMEEKDHKIDLSMKLAEEDEKTINDLKKQIEKAWRLADSAHAREQLAHEIIDNLRRQVENLNAELDFKNKLNQDDDDDMTKNRDGLERERDRLINEVTQLATKLQNAYGYQEELEKKNSQADLKINEIAGQLEDQNQENVRQKRVKDKLDAEIVDLKVKVDEMDMQNAELAHTVKEKTHRIGVMDKEIKDLKATHDKLSKELDHQIVKYSRLVDEHDNGIYETEILKRSYQEKVTENKLNANELSKMKNELSKILKSRDMLDKRMAELLREKEGSASERSNLKQKISVLEREIDDHKRFIAEEKRGIEILNKEKDTLSVILQRQQAAYRDQSKLMQIQDQAKKKLELELDLFCIESGKQKKLITRLERERDRLAEDQLDMTNTIQDQVEDIRIKKAFIFELKKDATEKDNKIKQQQNIYEAIRTERNALQKLLQESTSECSELKKKLRLLLHQIEQLKESITDKEKQLNKDDSIIRKVNKEKEQIKVDLMNSLQNIKELKEDVKNLKDEGKRLRIYLTQNGRTIRLQAKDIQQLMNERDILGSQLVRRNDEVALLNDKITILQAVLTRGETHYDLRLSDIRVLKLEIKRLRQEKNHIAKTMSSMADLRQEIFHLERDLTKSRLRCKALEQEVQTPLNIHRWRKLGGSDPDVLDLLQKIQILQRRSLQQASVAVERERQLKQAEKLYLNLRKVVAKQPGPAIQSQLANTKRALKQRGDKLKCLVTELDMANAKATEYKSDLAKLTDELAELKKKYLAEKKAQRTLRMAYESSRELNQSRSSRTGEVKFTGGGFRMSVSQISTK